MLIGVNLRVIIVWVTHSCFPPLAQLLLGFEEGADLLKALVLGLRHKEEGEDEEQDEEDDEDDEDIVLESFLQDGQPQDNFLNASGSWDIPTQAL